MKPTRKLLTLFGISAAIYALLVRPRIVSWGASSEELRERFPGEDLIPNGQRGGTMAVTINAPPARVWPWLVQMGCDRAGWYSWDQLDNAGVPSAEEIHPEWQDISVGDRLLSTPSGKVWFEVAAIEPERFLALRAPINLRTGRPFDTTQARPNFYLDGTWAFHLKPLPGERTRLLVSGYGCARTKLLQKLADFFFWELAHWIMQTRQFTNLKRRAERTTQI